MDVTVEYHKDSRLEGILIEDEKEVYFLPTTKYDIEEWVKQEGEEGTDYTLEKEWFDEYPNGGHYYDAKKLNKDAWEDQIRDYAFAHRKLWIQNSKEVA